MITHTNDLESNHRENNSVESTFWADKDEQFFVWYKGEWHLTRRGDAWPGEEARWPEEDEDQFHPIWHQGRMYVAYYNSQLKRFLDAEDLIDDDFEEDSGDFEDLDDFDEKIETERSIRLWCKSGFYVVGLDEPWPYDDTWPTMYDEEIITIWHLNGTLRAIKPFHSANTLVPAAKTKV